MSLRQALRSGVAAACIVGLASPVGAAAPRALAARSGLDVRVAQTETFSRIELPGVHAGLRREGQTIVVSLGGAADPDIARLRTSPPRWIKTAEKTRIGGGWRLSITLADDAEAKFGVADGATYINVFERPAPDPTVAATPEAVIAEVEPPRPDPRPPGGVVRVDAKVNAGQVQLAFTWANPAGAAVFRRGDAVWVVFDAPATLDLASAPKGLPMLRGVEVFQGADYAALRIDAPHDTPVFAGALGSTWTISLGPGQQAQPGLVRVTRDAASGAASLKAPVAGATRVINLPDRVVGDILTVVTALGPAKGMPTRRDFVELALLPSIQGLAIQPLIEDLKVSRDGEIIHIGRAEGLTLSPAWAIKDHDTGALGAPRPAAMPALIGQDWGKTGEGGFLARNARLVSAAAAERGMKDRESPVAARMALARFLVGSDLAFEAIGVLNDTADDHPEMLDDPEFRGLRGVARVLARRYAEAETDFSAAVLTDDPSTALWRSYLNVQLAHWAEARTLFDKGAEAYGLFSPTWRARFARASAQAALAQGDIAGAEAGVRMGLEEKVSPEERLQVQLIQARVIELQGSKARALKVYAAISTAPFDYISAPAVLRATQIRLELGQVTPLQAVGVFDGLRYRWRGDATELETIRALGHLYLSQGRYREALEALHSAGTRLPDLPEALQLQSDLATAFRGLFLDGLADGLEPVQALALFYDFKELTPIGGDGDLMVRKLVRRLVDVDLLQQAAELLKYQVENRLDGIPKAQVSTDLAVIYLMDRKPEQALEAINSSRTTVLPQALNAERRLIEARAWAGVGRFDSALEIIERDASKDANDLRGEITWRQKNWAVAGPVFEKSLGERWKSASPLTADEEGRLLRAGVAYSLTGDTGALDRLEARYQSFYDKASNPEALRIALSGMSSGRLSAADFSRVAADTATFAGWVDKMKGRFKTRAAPLGTVKAPVAPARQAEAAPKAAKG